MYMYLAIPDGLKHGAGGGHANARVCMDTLCYVPFRSHWTLSRMSFMYTVVSHQPGSLPHSKTYEDRDLKRLRGPACAEFV